jgi:hypothetical protein
LNETDGEWEQRRLPLTLWEIGRVFRGKMLALGWMPDEFEERIARYRIVDILLAMNPQVAMGDLEYEGQQPVNHLPSRVVEAKPVFVEGS